MGRGGSGAWEIAGACLVGAPEGPGKPQKEVSPFGLIFEQGHPKVRLAISRDYSVVLSCSRECSRALEFWKSLPETHLHLGEEASKAARGPRFFNQPKAW